MWYVHYFLSTEDLDMSNDLGNYSIMMQFIVNSTSRWGGLYQNFYIKIVPNLHCREDLEIFFFFLTFCGI